MPYDLAEVQNAYNKLRSYIYYDNSDVLLRRQFVEFETNTTKDINSFFVRIPKPYKSKKPATIFDELPPRESVVPFKLDYFVNQVNNYHKDSSFFDHFIENIKVNFYPKSIKANNSDPNFITNKRVLPKYEIDRITAFIDAPIELHLISVLWILKSGYILDKDLDDNCLGNRLILNQEKDGVVQGSGLFKPYFSQYQKWRDNSVKAAKMLLEKNKDVLFINLDIKNYFHSVRISKDKLYKPSKNHFRLLQHRTNVDEIFLKIHLKYTELVGRQYETPKPFYNELEKDDLGNLKQVVLPIGLLSSYVLANDYLKEFDKKVVQRIKPTYYSRYVDDILFVMESNNETETELTNVSHFRRIIERDFSGIFTFSESDSNKEESDLLMIDHPSLCCQRKKSLIYYFDHEESDIVIDKLKKELDEKTSEFRDFPEGDEKDDFEDSAYHLNYDGSDGKIRTLKNYKENRYGLTVYLANKIFSALRHEKRITEEEKNQVLKFFRGINCLEFYRLWERIFTFFLVNEQSEAYVEFYIHCAQQIDRIVNVENDKIYDKELKRTLIEYLDATHELALSLNPSFFKGAKKAARNFEFELNRLDKDLTFMFLSFDPTRPNSFWVERYRVTNMMRHHYVIHPLLNFTKKSKSELLNLVGPDLDFNDFQLDDELLKSSPRPVKYWECCLAIAFEELNKFQRDTNQDDGYAYTSLLGVSLKSESAPSFHLDDAFDLYKKINSIHIAQYELEDKDFKNKFYRIDQGEVLNDLFKEVSALEITVNSATSKKLHRPKIAFANTQVEDNNITDSIRGRPNLKLERYQKLAHIIEKSRKENAEILLFPECFVPINLLSSIVRYSEKNEVLTITGLEHVVQSKTAFNFIITILPFEIHGTKDAVVVFRLKNHYSHAEEELIRGNHKTVPKPTTYRYDLFNWRNIYFATYYCFELTDSFHRSLFRGKVDLLVGVEWNKDTPYFSNIVEAGSRDLHSYVAQVNTSQYGDTRLTQPAESAKKDILRLKGGINDAVLVAAIDIERLRTFQLQKYSLTHAKGEFKPLPPDFLLDDVQKRIDNQSVLRHKKKKI